MKVDAATILALTAAIAVLSGLVLWAFERTQKPGIPHLRQWGYAALMQGVGLAIAMGLRSALPYQTGIVTGNLVLFAGIILYGRVVADHAGRPLPRGIQIGLFLSFALAHSACLYIWPNLSARMAIFSFGTALLLIVSAQRLYFPDRAARPGERFVALLFGIAGLLMLLRAAAQYPFDDGTVDLLFSESRHAGMFHALALVVTFMTTLGFTFLAIERSRLDQEQAIREKESQREIFQRQFEMLPVSTNIWRIEGDDFVLESANFASQVMSEGKIWSQVGMSVRQLPDENQVIREGLSHCRDTSSYFVREAVGVFGRRSTHGRYQLTFNRLSPQLIAVYSEEKQPG